MPEVPINYLAVLVAAVAAFLAGGLWYSPILFGKMWMHLTGKTEQDMKKGNVGMSYLLAFLFTLLMSYVLAHALVFASAYLKATGVQAGLMAAVWNWLGFVLPVQIWQQLWEGKSWKLFLINGGHTLVGLLVMGVILSLWPAA